MAGSPDGSGNWRTVAPITLVTSFAVYGQFAWGLEALRQDVFALTVVIAGGAAAAFESISLYVQWHAHDALLRKDTATAAKYRRWSYLLAGIAAAVNYSHFSTGWQPTPAAVMFALFSMSSPWLWGLHTRRAHHIQLRSEGRIDDTGALFSTERWRHFPWRTLQARRYSIDHGITDPQVAWAAYRLELQRRSDDLPGARQQLAADLRRLDRIQDRASWAADMVSPIDVPELERYEDVVVPDPEQVDDRGLSLRWKTAPATAAPERRPNRRVTPPAEVDTEQVRKLAAEGKGRRAIAKELGTTPYAVRKVLDSPKLNGHKVPTP